jgi:hypothetical protein
MTPRRACILATILAVALPLGLLAKTAPTPGPMSTATMPSCASADPVVWVNTSSKVYHAKSSPWFGRTNKGMYACTSQAVASAAKPAGIRKTGGEQMKINFQGGATGGGTNGVSKQMPAPGSNSTKTKRSASPTTAPIPQ